MSLDVWLEHPRCTACERTGEPVLEYSSTYNVSKMWYVLFPKHTSFCPIDSCLAKDVIPMMQEGVQLAVANRKELEAMNPVNGWGSYETFLKFLRNILAASQDHPDLIWRTDR